MWSKDLNGVLDYCIVFLPLLFVIVYTVINPWWKNIVSRAVCGLMLSVSFIPMARIVAEIGGWPVRGPGDGLYSVLQVAFKTPTALMVAICVWVLIKLQQEKKNGTLEKRKN